MGEWIDRWMQMKKLHFHQAISPSLLILLYLKSRDA